MYLAVRFIVIYEALQRIAFAFKLKFKTNAEVDNGCSNNY